MGNLEGEHSSHFYLRASRGMCSARRFCLRGERLILERGLPYLRQHFRGQWVCPKYRTFITFKEHLSHVVEHSLDFTMCLSNCEHSYTELKQICQILCDIRHVANGCVSKGLTPPWSAKLDLSDMQNIRHF